MEKPLCTAEKHLSALEERLSNLETCLSTTEKRLSIVEEKLSAVEGRLLAAEETKFVERKPTPHGLFFVNEFEFNGATEFQRRPEAVNNADRLKDALAKFGIVVIVEKNVSISRMKERIQQFYRTPNKFNHVDSIWLLISSHGGVTEEGEDIIDGNKYEGCEKLKSLLDTLNSVLQTPKPVVIIIQSCRGEKTPFTLEAPSQDDPDDEPNPKLNLDDGFDAGAETRSSPPFKFPGVLNLKSNQILLWSVTPGNTAIRGFLFNSLSEVLGKSNGGEELEKIFTKVINDVSRNKKNKDGYKVSPIYYSRLFDEVKMTREKKLLNNRGN